MLALAHTMPCPPPFIPHPHSPQSCSWPSLVPLLLQTLPCPQQRQTLPAQLREAAVQRRATPWQARPTLQRQPAPEALGREGVEGSRIPTPGPAPALPTGKDVGFPDAKGRDTGCGVK